MDRIRIFGLDLRRVGKLLSVGDENGAPPPLPPSSEANACTPEGNSPGEPTTPGADLEQPGSWIGPYKLLQVLGEGGMGIVYLAEQEHPIRRQVALKVIKPGMDSRQVIARFEAERQALALLDHPNIAHVFDAGTTENGRPYFVMEYIDGLPITNFCDQQKLSVEERLRLFVQVCEGVQHAHQKGIIHRDIKPSNVLIHKQGGEPLPKIIDFGVAKAVTTPLTERTLFTEQGQLLGTLDYMSPEQAEMTRHDIDTRSDIYSLGVLLYVLLTGALPFDRETLRQAGIAEILRIVREQDPPRPSMRLATGGPQTGQIAENRKTNHKTLARMTRGDLDWIVMKTLEKDRRRRYETAHALAEDIQRHLSDEPVLAGRPGLLQRSRKFIRRNRALVTGVAAVFLVLAAGIVGVTLFAVQAQQARTRAEQALEEVRRRDRIATAQRLYEEGRYQDALAAIESDATHEKASAGTRLLYARLLLALRRVEEAKRLLESLVTEPPEIAGAAHQLLSVIYADSNSAMAEEHRRQGESLLPQTADAYCFRAMTALATPRSAVSTSPAMAWLSQALNLEPGHYLARKTRALVYYALGDLQAMEQDAEALIAIQPTDSFGYALRAISRRRKGLMDEAIHDHDRAIQFCKDTSTLAEFQDQRRLTLLRKGDPLAALISAKLCENLQPGRLDYQFNVFAGCVALSDYEAAQEKSKDILEVHPEYEKELMERAQKYVFDTLGAGGTLAIPEPILADPVFSVMQEALDSYHALASKAARVLPLAAAHMNWSPDGRQFAYSRSPLSASEIGTLVNLVPGMFAGGGIMVWEVESGTTRLLVPFGNDPAWSPDGKWIAFADKSEFSDRLSEEVWLISAQGGEPKRLALGGWPQWGDDSKRLFFHSRVDGALCRIDVTEPNAKPEVLMACPNRYPLVSRDGRYVAYQEGRKLHILELSTQKAVAEPWLNPGCQNGFLADWSPDGKELSFSAPNSGLWILNADNKKARLVLASPAQRGVWSRDKSCMTILVAHPYGAEIWLARLDPNMPTCESLAPAGTWRDYVGSRCEQCRNLATRTPTRARECLSSLSAFGTDQYLRGQYEDSILALRTVDQLRREVLREDSPLSEVALEAQAFCYLGRYDDAEVLLVRLREEVTQGKHLQGQKYWWDAERLFSGENGPFTGFWRAINAGDLNSAAQELETLESLAPTTPRFGACLEGARCVLAAARQSHQVPGPGQSDGTTIKTLPGLVSYWPGDGNARDLAGPNHGTPVGDTKFAQGCMGQAFCFDGDGDFVRASGIGISDLQQFTVAFWVKLESMPAGKICEFVKVRPAKVVLRYDGIYSPRCLHYYTRGPDGMMHHIWANGALQEKVFCHVAGTYDGQMMRLYLNGTEVGACARTGPLQSGGDVSLGRSLGGLLDEVQVYSRALAPGEIAALAHVDQAAARTSPGPAPDTFAQAGSAIGGWVSAPAVRVRDAEQFSVALWVKLDRTSLGSAQRFVTLDTRAELYCEEPSDRRRLCFHMSMTDGKQYHIDANGLLDTEAFHHVVGTYDGHMMRLFFDAVPVGMCRTSGLPGYEERVKLGCELCGLLDEVRIYDRVLNSTEIQELYSSNDMTISENAPGLVSWWRLDETSGTTAHDFVGSNHGIVFGGATWTPGKFGGALHFSPREIGGLSDPNVHGDETPAAGRATDNQEAAPNRSVVHARVDAPGNGIDDLQKFSMALWVKLDALPPDRIQRFITLAGEKAVLRYDGSNGAHFYMRMTDDAWSHIHAEGVFDTKAYHHIAGTYNGHAMRLYFDGAQVAMRETTGLSIRGEGVGLGSSDEPLYGELDEVQIYDRALDEREIQELYAKDDVTLPVGMAKPIAWWNFDEMSGTIARDWVGSNDATLQGATWTPGKFGGALHFDTAEPAEAAAHWRLDGDTQDSAGTNHGVVHGNPVWTSGHIGGALQFDGTDDYVDCGNSEVFHITDKMTTAAWIKVTAFNAPIQAVVTKGDSSWRLQRSGETSAACFHCNLQTGQLLTAGGSKPVDDGNWHHVAGVFDGSRCYLYVDGELDAVTSPTPGNIATNACPVWIGDNYEAPGSGWCGLIDDVRIYNRALSIKEIAARADQ